MPDEDREQRALEAKGETALGQDEDEEVASPFDHPAFLPVLLWAVVLWFGYDGWLNPDYQAGGDKHDSLAFSRYGFAGLLVFAVYTTLRLLRELRAEQDSGPGGETHSDGE